VQQLLGWDINILIDAALDWNFSVMIMNLRNYENYSLTPPALIPSNLLAVWSCLRFTVRSALDLTFEFVYEPCGSD
jgi:hypothetical protein